MSNLHQIHDDDLVADDSPNVEPTQTDQFIAIVSCIGCILSRLYDNNNNNASEASQDNKMTIFRTSHKPNLTIQDYFRHIVTHCECSDDALIHALIYINKLMAIQPDFVISSLNIHRLLLTSILCACKFTDDIYFNNDHFANIGAIYGTDVLNKMEVEFLKMMKFDLYISPLHYWKFVHELVDPIHHKNCNCKFQQVKVEDIITVESIATEMNRPTPVFQVLKTTKVDIHE